MPLLLLYLCLCNHCNPDWGFFGHRQINKHAVYIIPPPLNQFFKKHIAFLEEHSVDADKRRYAIPQEYKRHYIDLDYHEDSLNQPLSDNLELEIRKQLVFKIIQHSGDTLTLSRSANGEGFLIKGDSTCYWPLGHLTRIVDSLLSTEPHEEIWIAPPSSLKAIINSCGQQANWKAFVVEDHFSIHGILPYWLVIMQRRLTNAFLARDVNLVLKLASDLGHYIGDAHVPLHTTRNYNGQLTAQHGIHGFWESRIPELFYNDWDLITGPAEYIPDFKVKTWEIVRESYSLVAVVLQKEREVRSRLPEDQILCFEDRNAFNMLTYCPDFARAYAMEMDGMVDEQFRSAIQFVGSAWYTAWIDAGQPALWDAQPSLIRPVEEERVSPAAVPFGRPHEN